MTVDIEQLRDYWDANMAEWNEARAAHIHESLPELLDELERWRCATYSATPEALSEDVANSVLEHVEVMSELERLRRLETADLRIAEGHRKGCAGAEFDFHVDDGDCDCGYIQAKHDRAAAIAEARAARAKPFVEAVTKPFVEAVTEIRAKLAEAGVVVKPGDWDKDES